MSRSAKFYEIWAWLTLIVIMVTVALQLVLWEVIPPSIVPFRMNIALLITISAIAGVIMIVSGIIAYCSLFTDIDLSENTLGAKIILFGLGFIAFFIVGVIFVLHYASES